MKDSRHNLTGIVVLMMLSGSTQAQQFPLWIDAWKPWR